MEGGSYYRKGLWTEEEDKILIDYIREHGKGRWSRVSKITGLKRCGKSCRLRWMNYLSPHVKKGEFSEEEEDLIIRLHKLLGNRWSLIAGRVPGRTDNQVKNYWNTHLSKKLGIKKAKKKASTSSLIVTQECKQEIGNLNLPTSSQTELPISDDNSRAIGSIESKDASQAVSASTAPQEPKMSECVGSVLFANDSANLSTPSLMEIFESYSLDMFWNGF